jgi:ABC-type amino acid transport substrate-binding protein
MMKRFPSLSQLSTIIISVVAVALGSCSSSGESEEVHDKTPLIFGTSATYPPFEQTTLNGEIEGFDIEVAEEIARRLGRELVVKDLTFESLLPSVNNRSIDIALAALAITPQRLKKVAMVPYHGEPITAYVLAFWKNIPQGIASLEDVSLKPAPRIGVMKGTVQAAYLAQFPEIDVKIVEDVSTLVLDLRNKHSLGFLVEPQVAKLLHQKIPELRLVKIPLAKSEWILGNGIAIERGNKKLIQQVTSIIQDRRNERFIQRLQDKWFNIKKETT